MDPVTILAMTSAAFNGVKKAISMGREVQDIYSQLSKWANYAGELNDSISKSSKSGSSALASVTGQAFDIMAAKAQLQHMEKEIHRMFIYGELQELGSAGYHEFILLRRKLKAEKEAAEQEKYRKRAKLLENAFWGTILAVVLSLGIYVGIIFYQLGNNAGKW